MDHFKQGIHTRQAHKAIPEGHYEEEQGLLGFFGPASHLIRKEPSTRWKEIDGPLRPHMYDLVRLDSSARRVRMLYNDSVSISMEYASAQSSKTLIADRNADGDMLYFCHEGEGEFLTEYGCLPFSKGEYVVVPKSIAYVILPHHNATFFAVENRSSHYEQPDRGLAGRHAIYDPNAVGQPDLDRQAARLKLAGEVKGIRVKRENQFTTFRYDDCIFADIVGWKGDLYPYSLHTANMMPLMSHRAHLPPSAHTTFVAKDFVICTFLPRPLEKDRDALKVPFYHQNIDYDEVLFYHAGDFFSRDNLHPGMMSFHPAGFPHGPHPKAIKSIDSKVETSEHAVMVDTRLPLQIDSQVERVELLDYWKSWQK